MNFLESISVCFSKYANFDERASRSEYWWFYLFCILLIWGMGILGIIAGGGGYGYDMLSGLASLITIVPSLAVGARRLHDTGKSGWHQLWAITIIGIIPLIIWFCTEGSKESNKFGDPIILKK
tara:strand:+ start:43 stop:411 length:369 start_codon:yes stop_codon:yes gene_type:complete